VNNGHWTPDKPRAPSTGGLWLWGQKALWGQEACTHQLVHSNGVAAAGGQQHGLAAAAAAAAAAFN